MTDDLLEERIEWIRERSDQFRVPNSFLIMCPEFVFLYNTESDTGYQKVFPAELFPLCKDVISALSAFSEKYQIYC